jgi:hypothetical protein
MQCPFPFILLFAFSATRLFTAMPEYTCAPLEPRDSASINPGEGSGRRRKGFKRALKGFSHPPLTRPSPVGPYGISDLYEAGFTPTSAFYSRFYELLLPSRPPFFISSSSHFAMADCFGTAHYVIAPSYLATTYLRHIYICHRDDRLLPQSSIGQSRI